jgi:hypothetical protein
VSHLRPTHTKPPHSCFQSSREFSHYFLHVYTFHVYGLLRRGRIMTGWPSAMHSWRGTKSDCSITTHIPVVAPSGSWVFINTDKRIYTLPFPHGTLMPNVSLEPRLNMEQIFSSSFNSAEHLPIPLNAPRSLLAPPRRLPHH